MPGDYDFFAPARPEPAAVPPPADSVWGQPAPWTTQTSRPRHHRLVLVVAAVLAVAASTAARLVAAPAHYDNLIAHEGIADASAGWAPLYTSGGQPARWDACSPIHYVVNTAYAPPSGTADLNGALLRVQKATGLTFVLDGQTSELPSASTTGVHRGPDGRLSWTPVLIGWEPMGRDSGIEGLTVPIAVPGPDGGSIVTARVEINSDLLLPPGFGPGVSEGLVILHELGHAVGLGHVGDPAQVMYPRVKGGYADFGAGDRAGLKALGAPAGCHPAPPARPLRLKDSSTG